MLPTLLDLLDSSSDPLIRVLTGLLRNLSRHCRDKEAMGESGLQETDFQREP